MASLLGLEVWKPRVARTCSPVMFFALVVPELLVFNMSSSFKAIRTTCAIVLASLWLIWPFNFRLVEDPAQEDPFGMEASLGMVCFCLSLVTLDRLVWSELESFQRVVHVQPDGNRILEPVPPPFSKERIMWASSLIVSLRKLVIALR